MRNIQRSPDGRTIVFAALRRLYVVRRAGGMSRPLVLQPEGQFHPAISPDGRWVAYVTWHDTAGGHLWRLPLTGGTPERLSAAAGLYERPTWSPDGRTIAVIRSEISLARGLSVLQLVSVADRRVRVIAKNLMGGHTPSFSGDGRRIYSIRHAVAAPRTLVSVRVDGSDERESWPGLVPRDETAFEAAVPSPDGKYVAVIEYGNLYLVHMPPRSSPAHAGDTVDAVPTVVQVTREGAYDPVWNSDGKTLTWSFAHTLYHANVDRLLESARLASASGSGQSRPNVAASASASATPIRLTVPRHKPRGTLALRGARVITMRGNEVIPAGTIVVTDNRITAVGPVDAIAIPAAATVLDVSGKTIIPGLMDLHAHYNTTNLPIDVLAQNWWGMLANLAHGVTTVRDPSAPRGTYAYEELLEAGITTGPRLFGAPAMAPSNHKIETPEDARGYARQYKALGATFMKTHSGWPRRERQWMIAAARAEGLNIAVHLSDETGVLLRWLNLSPLIDGVTGTEHNILWSDRIYGDVERFWAQAGTWQNPSNDAGKAYARFDGKRWNRDPRARAFYVPPSDVGAGIELGEDTHSIGEPEASWARTVAGILRAGGNVSIGTHGGFFQGAGVHWEMWVLARSGLTNHEALRVATLGGARGIGIQQDLGSIEVGKLADLVVLDRNPLENIEHSVSTVYVMKNGVLYDATTLTTVWPTRRALPAWRYPGWTYNE
jgi:imidazolonepropionase-like amidohydrolase